MPQRLPAGRVPEQLLDADEPHDRQAERQGEPDPALHRGGQRRVRRKSREREGERHQAQCNRRAERELPALGTIGLVRHALAGIQQQEQERAPGASAEHVESAPGDPQPLGLRHRECQPGPSPERAQHHGRDQHRRAQTPRQPWTSCAANAASVKSASPKLHAAAVTTLPSAQRLVGRAFQGSRAAALGHRLLQQRTKSKRRARGRPGTTRKQLGRLYPRRPAAAPAPARGGPARNCGSRASEAASVRSQRAPSPNSTTRTVSRRMRRSRNSEWFFT